MNTNKQIILCFFLVVVLAFSCSKPKKKLPFQFYKTDLSQKLLSGSEYRLSNVSYPINMCIIPDENLLLVTDNQNAFVVNVYDLTTIKYIRSFIEKGTKPNQQIVSRNLQYDSEHHLLYSSDMYKKKIFVYSVKELRDTTKKIYPVADLSYNSDFFQRPLILPGDKIVDFHENTIKSEQGVIDFYQKDGNRISTKGEYPKIEEQYEPDQLNFAFFSCMTLSKDRSHLIINYFHTDYIDIYDLEGNLQRREQGPDLFDPKIISASVSGGTIKRLTKESFKAYAAKPYMDQRNIYTLYSGKKDAAGDYHANLLFNFSPDFLSKRAFVLNIPIFEFDINPKTNILYGIANKPHGSYLIKYQLP